MQDTTMLNYNTLRFSTGGLVLIGGGDGRMGVPVHTTLAVSEGGRPLGVFHLEGDFRPAKPARASRKRQKEPSPEAGATGLEPSAQAAGTARSRKQRRRACAGCARLNAHANLARPAGAHG